MSRILLGMLLVNLVGNGNLLYPRSPHRIPNLEIQNVTLNNELYFRGARYITDFDGWWIFCTMFHEDSKNIILFKIGHTQSTHKLCPAWLLIKTDQPSPADIVRWLGVSNIKKIIFLESSWKVIQNMYQPARSDNFFLKMGTLTIFRDCCLGNSELVCIDFNFGFLSSRNDILHFPISTPCSQCSMDMYVHVLHGVQDQI